MPSPLRGTSSGNVLIHVSDWYATFCKQAGVDPKDSPYIDGAYRDINGVDVWPMLLGTNTTQPRMLTPTTEASIIQAATTTPAVHHHGHISVDAVASAASAASAAAAAGTRSDAPNATATDAGITVMWKLITLAGQSNYYTPNATNIPANDPCLAGRQPDPPQPPGRTDPLVNGGCPVCNATQPCLYDLIADPQERVGFFSFWVFFFFVSSFSSSFSDFCFFGFWGFVHVQIVMV